MIVGNESAPRNIPETLFATLVVFLGSLVTAFIFGNLAVLMSTANKHEN
jgi:hypothetical protein